MRDLNRYRKVYPQIRLRPRWEVCENPINLLMYEIDFSNSLYETITIPLVYDNPVIILTPNDNINAYVANYWKYDDYSILAVQVSHLFTGKVYVAISERSEQ